MAMEETTGADKLVQRILNDARADAEKIAGETEAKRAAILKESEAQLAARKADYEKKRAMSVASVLDGCKTRAALDGRKDALKKKRVVIERVFEETYQKLIALPEKEREEICRNLLLGEAEGGETVVPAKADREAVKRVLDGWKGVSLTLSQQDAPLDGGFLLVNAGYEKDCSFRALLAQLRDSEETQVAGRLFGRR